MAKKLNHKQTVDFKELLMSEVIQSEALINLIDKKGLVSKTRIVERNEESSGVDDEIIVMRIDLWQTKMYSEPCIWLK